MTCPVCGEKTAVVDTVKDIDTIYRRRKCKNCGYYFFTVEEETNDSEYFNTLKQAEIKRSKERKKKCVKANF